jgi:hypothetical protein
MTEHTTTVLIADGEGHRTLQLTQAETLDLVDQNPSFWVFSDNQMVKRESLAEADFSTIDTVCIVPALVGG